MNEAMQLYHKLQEKRPQVLGLTASPAKGMSLVEVQAAVAALCRNLGGAKVHFIDEADPEVAAVVASPSQDDCLVGA
jgi:ERCC4-related helicase